MPKSKVRKKKGGVAAAAPSNRTPVKVAGGPSSTLYVSVMLGLMIIGLAWLILMYLSGSASWLTWMADLGGWNYLIGFGFMVAGLLMTMGWR
ncbi:cell division protein CrgA [Tomitella cavernea]|uniref:Cell division protein CrgA n=1 Tax=Tomitella cavernea TaxID=1387982 RepID=A0ABP9C443_9ACTN|nr:cell division protein CrgA [Tomitella cavernea]